MIPNPLTHLRVGVERLRSSRFARNVATVGGGIAAAQAIALAFTPFLTRLYGPEAFGAMAAYMAVVSIITPLATLGFANAVVMPDSEEGARAVARLSILCGAIVAPLALVLVHFAKPWLAIWTGLEATPAFLYLIPLSLLLGAVLSVANQAAIREDLFKPKARTYVESTLMMNLGKLAGGLLAPSGLLLIVMSVAGPALNASMLVSRVPKRGAFKLRSWFGVKGIRDAAREQRDFALYRMPQSVIRATSIGLPVIVLTTLFGAGAAGQYSITVLLLSAPVMLLGDSVGEVFFPKITRSIQAEPDRAGALIRKASLVLALMGLVPFGTIAIFGSWIFPLVLGEEWARAGEYSQWVAVWMAAMMVARPAITAMPALRMQGALLMYEVVITLARIAALYAGFKLGDDLTAITAFALVNVAGYAALLLVVLVKVANLRGKASHA